MTRYLVVADLVWLNARLCEKWGGLSGVRDMSLLESAVGRLQTGYYTDVVEEGAALCESLLQNHPFIDGNKRCAVVATAVFLRWNDHRISFDDREMYEWLMDLYGTKTVTQSAIAAWLRQHIISA